MYYPNFINNSEICDCVYNDNNAYIIIFRCVQNYIIKLNINNEICDFESIKCPYKNNTIYICKNNQYYDNINISIDDNIHNIKVSSYPSFENEIIMSTVVKNEDEYIIQWIEYYKNLGVSRFIIYDNSKNYIHYWYKSKSNTSNLEKKLKDYLEKKIVILIDWGFTTNFQATQQHHSIYTFTKSKYIGLFDIDEYINPQNNILNLDIIFENELMRLNKTRDQIGGFTILCKLFYNPDNLPENDYNFFNIFNCDDIVLAGREKMFVVPKNIKIFGIHRITFGLNEIRMDKTQIYFNHYFFLNKESRGREKKILQDDSIKKITNLFFEVKS